MGKLFSGGLLITLLDSYSTLKGDVELRTAYTLLSFSQHSVVAIALRCLPFSTQELRSFLTI